MGRILTTIVLLYLQLQGRKLTFLGSPNWRLKFNFSHHMQKCGRQKSVNNIFSAQRNTNRWKTLVVNFSFENQNAKNTFLAAMVIFVLTNKIKYKQSRLLFMHLSLKTMSNRSNAGHYGLHIRSFVRLLNVSSQLYTLSCA